MSERRVVSLVPSATETLLTLGVRPRACTRFCDQPGIPTVGGTKNPDVDAIVALAPALVVVNDEENRREDAVALEAAGLTLHSMSPRSVAGVGPAVAALADAVGAPVPVPFTSDTWPAWLSRERALADPMPRTAVALIWRRPWMTIARDTYGASLLELLGLAPVDLDTNGSRYPEVMLETLAAAAPDLVLLTSEPYAFRARHVDEVRAAVPAADVRLADGRDLFWWGARTPRAMTRLRTALAP